MTYYIVWPATNHGWTSNLYYNGPTVPYTYGYPITLPYPEKIARDIVNHLNEQMVEGIVLWGENYLWQLEEVKD